MRSECMMFGIERKLFDALSGLKEEYGLVGVKCEFEAEGSSFEEVVRLREMCSRAGVGLNLKIGGAEAKSDVLSGLVLGVDGLMAPMIESDFAIYKFRKLIDAIYPDVENRPEIAINIETRTAAECMDAILVRSAGFLDQVTFGRSDLSGSYFSKEITPDSDFLMDVVMKKAVAVKAAGLRTGMGGSISIKTINKLRETNNFTATIDIVETRKCILPSKGMLKDGALAKCFEFEKLYLLSVKERNDLFNRANTERLVKLEQRAV